MKKIATIILIIVFAFIPANTKNITFDKNQYVVLKFDKVDRLFNDKCKATSLNKDEIDSIYQIINKAVSEFNSKKKIENTNQPINDFFIDLSNYKVQLIPVLNSKGEKEIFVNCICNQSSEIKYFKKQFIFVLDGGNCYFQLKINLQKKSYYHFYMNGSA